MVGLQNKVHIGMIAQQLRVHAALLLVKFIYFVLQSNYVMQIVISELRHRACEVCDCIYCTTFVGKFG